MGDVGDGSLLKKMNELDLTEDENKIVEVDSEDEEGQELRYAAVAKVLTSKPVNHKVLVNNLGNVWGTSRSMKYKSVSQNLIILDFATEKDRGRVLNGGPWNYRNYPIIFLPFDSLQRPSEMAFNLLPIWIRIYDLPLGLMNNKTAKLVGGLCGEVMEFDIADEAFGWGEYLRVRVKMDISKPLRRGVLLKTPKSKNPHGDWFELRYERLPFFCFHCGRVGHELCGCATEEKTVDRVPKYNESLRAPLASWGFEVEKLSKGKNNKATGEPSAGVQTPGPGDQANTEGGTGVGEQTTKSATSAQEEGAGRQRPGEEGTRYHVAKTPRQTENIPPEMKDTDTLVYDLDGDKEVSRALVPMDEDISLESLLSCRNTRKKRGREVLSEVLLLTNGQDEEAGGGETGECPKMKRKKDLQPSAYSQNTHALSARAAKQQPRRAQ